MEGFRKDFEKLLREGVPGLWFHTLTKANDRTWHSIENMMHEALDRVRERAGAATHSVHFAFCVLDPPTLVEFDLDFSADWRDHLGPRFLAAQKTPLRPEWVAKAIPKRAAPPRPKAHSYNGAQRKALVYIPSIEPRSFIHLSTKGDSYALRSFGGARPRSRWVEPECRTTTKLFTRHPIVHQEDVAREKENLESELKYWAARVAELNRKYGIG